MKTKKWLVTRTTHTTIEVESGNEPLQGDDKWTFEDEHYGELAESYRNDGLTYWEVQEVQA